MPLTGGTPHSLKGFGLGPVIDRCYDSAIWPPYLPCLRPTTVFSDRCCLSPYLRWSGYVHRHDQLLQTPPTHRLNHPSLHLVASPTTILVSPPAPVVLPAAQSACSHQQPAASAALLVPPATQPTTVSITPAIPTPVTITKRHNGKLRNRTSAMPVPRSNYMPY